MTQDVDTDAIEEARKARKRERDRARYAANPEKKRERDRARYAANPEKARERARARRAANPEKARECVRAWREANPEKKRECDRAWYVANQEKAREASRARRAANPEKVRKSDRARRVRRKASDPVLYKREVMLCGAKGRSRLKGLAFDITIDDISAPITCPVLGIELNWLSRVKTNNSPSLDRIVPELGYVRGNVMVISDRANIIKRDATPDELRRIADFYATRVVNVNDTKEDSNDTEN